MTTNETFTATLWESPKACAKSDGAVTWMGFSRDCALSIELDGRPRYAYAHRASDDRIDPTRYVKVTTQGRVRAALADEAFYASR